MGRVTYSGRTNIMGFCSTLTVKDRKQMAEAEFEITDEGGAIVEAVRFSDANSPD
jgi:hypothetical protein